MQNIDKQKLLDDAKAWFTESFAKSHIKNTLKLIDPNEFKINHFTTTYLAKFLKVVIGVIYPMTCSANT